MLVANDADGLAKWAKSPSKILVDHKNLEYSDVPARHSFATHVLGRAQTVPVADTAGGQCMAWFRNTHTVCLRLLNNFEIKYLTAEGCQYRKYFGLNLNIGIEFIWGQLKVM